MSVEVLGKGFIDMANLQVKDQVRVGDDSFSTVYMFGHHDKTAKVEFLQIHMDALQAPLELSGNHMVFVDGVAVEAAQVKVGDVIDNKIVTRIDTVSRMGYYAPYTYSGDIKVNGVRASNYGTIAKGVASNIQHHVVHVVMSLPRLVCSSGLGVCDTDVYTDALAEGLFVPVGKMIGNMNMVASALAVLVVLALFAPLYGLEQLLAQPALVLAAVAGYMAYKKSKTSIKVKMV